MDPMTRRFRGWPGLLAGLLAAAAICAGCDDPDYHHDPPAGLGALIVDNYTGKPMGIHVDAIEVSSVSADKHRYVDLEPGVHRVALDDEDSERFWTDSLDIFEGRLTVLEVRQSEEDDTRFDVRVNFE